MEMKEFESELGKVAVTETRLERKRSESEEWDLIEKNFDEDDLLDGIDFDEIDDIDFRKGSMYPFIKVKPEDEDRYKRIFFKSKEKAEDVFRLLRYRWHVFNQIY
ncbi:MAG: hypothetical protein ABEK01_03375 [Candidatus Nanohaloarchaea archaeon]